MQTLLDIRVANKFLFVLSYFGEPETNLCNFIKKTFKIESLKAGALTVEGMLLTYFDSSVLCIQNRVSFRG